MITSYEGPAVLVGRTAEASIEVRLTTGTSGALRSWGAVIVGGDADLIFTLFGGDGPLTLRLESGEEAEVILSSLDRLQGSGPPPRAPR